MTFRAAVAYPCIDHGRAVSELHGKLCELAAEEGAAAVEWSTVRVAGPEEVVDREGCVRYEWVATAEPAVPATP